MWKSTAGHNIVVPQQDADDDWETDTDFVNDVTEQEQRWGSKTIEGSGRTAGAIEWVEPNIHLCKLRILSRAIYARIKLR